MKRPMTPVGYASLRKELLKLKGSRVEVALAIEIARGHGDLSENGDYDAAKAKSGMVEAKIRDIEAKLANSQVIDPLKLNNPQKVTFGVTAELDDIDGSSGESPDRIVTIVGPDEGDLERGMISCESPFGRALIGKEAGDIAKVEAPGGDKEYEIRAIYVDKSLFEVVAEEL